MAAIGTGAARSPRATAEDREQGNRIGPESVGRLFICGNHSGNHGKPLKQLSISVMSGDMVSTERRYLVSVSRQRGSFRSVLYAAAFLPRPRPCGPLRLHFRNPPWAECTRLVFSLSASLF